MTIPFFTNPHTLHRLHEGPLGAYVDAYAALLQDQGYSRQSARHQLQLLAELGRWLQRKGLGAKDLTPHRIARYARYHKRHFRSHRDEASTLRRLLRLLRERGVVQDVAPRRDKRALQRVAEDFERYLAQERGLAAATLVHYVPFVRQFLRERFREGRIRLAALRAADITDFVQRHAHDHSPGHTKVMLTALRAFLRHLCQRGATATDLATCVPCVPTWRFATVPKYLPPGQVQQVLEACDRRTAAGRRDYAILLLLARLGLRAGEVVALRLEDIDWEASRLTLRSKGSRWSQLPLPGDVGEALAAYLQQGRPRCASRQVFIRLQAPLVGFANSIAVSTLVARALAHAGVEPPHTGAHVFRHSLATAMLREGASLAEIGELLRHQHPDTTTLYAKVDLLALRALALPWPGGGR